MMESAVHLTAGHVTDCARDESSALIRAGWLPTSPSSKIKAGFKINDTFTKISATIAARC